MITSTCHPNDHHTNDLKDRRNRKLSSLQPPPPRPCRLFARLSQNFVTSGFFILFPYSLFSSSKVYLLCKNRPRFCSMRHFLAGIDESFCFSVSSVFA